MKLSGHSYNNDIFHSLLDHCKNDVTLNIKTADKVASSDVDMFTSVTQTNFDDVLQEELDYIYKELDFAASRANMDIGPEDLTKFASQVKEQGLRGKQLERAAQVFCNDLYREVKSPQAATKVNYESTDHIASHSVSPASYSTDQGGPNDSITGKYMGCSKNPNSIWDSEAMQRFAQVKHGDEQIKESKQKEADRQQSLKQEQWQELQDKHSDPNQVKTGIIPTGHGNTNEVQVQNLPDNSMSIFDSHRDFENIPNQTVGERIAELASTRAEKKSQAKTEWNKVEASKKMSNQSWIDSIISKES